MERASDIRERLDPHLSFYVKDPDMVYYPGGDLFLFAAKEAEL